eukprot:28059_1
MAIMLAIFISTFIYELSHSQIITGTARLTWYQSYAPCCPENPNYDPNAPTTECNRYNACAYPGLFAALQGQQSFDFVQNTDITAFYDNSDPTGSNFLSRYGGKYVTLSKNGITFTALIADTCGNSDCNNCCAANSSPEGYLVDLEYYTAQRYFGIDNTNGDITFTIDLDQTVTDEPITGNIIIANQIHTQQWWVAFYLTNVDTSCGGEITNVEIYKNGQWISYNGNEYGYYTFTNFNTALSNIPFSVRITKSNPSSDSETIVSGNVVTLSGGATFDFGSNFCTNQATNSVSPTNAPTAYNPPTNIPTVYNPP